ncbi:hypothetical protein [[Mycobacterium] burgundiense]|uniref:Uncharacterized protein n=1 Tax=[Mycobacterium] burgundiense TaxID=3064286 RepID=A0ABN9NFL2_9MYCO|nr:hypothetical protein [Mycolicibacterium sp. MU0053]CAJ1505540.1 hypothetical protein MU0053_002961 [Mycolicibacterium sp. MU0053]
MTVTDPNPRNSTRTVVAGFEVVGTFSVELTERGVIEGSIEVDEPIQVA